MMVFGVHLEMLIKMVNPVGEHSYLDLTRSAILIVSLKLGYYTLFLLVVHRK